MPATNSPRSFSLNPGLLKSLLLETPGCLVAAFGDSTWAGIGGPGNYDMAWMQYLWAEYFGGVSGTELSYPDQTRGLALTGPVSDSFVMSDMNGNYIIPTGATKANPCVVTAASHGLGNGAYVKVVGETGMSQLNGNTYKVNNVAANTFELQTTAGVNVDSSAYGTFNGLGVWYTVSRIADSYLTPHRNVAGGNGYVYRYSAFDGYGHFTLLNHAHDNQASADGGPFGDYYGYNQVPAWMFNLTPTLGSAAFAGGTMIHGRSLIDASNNGAGLSKLKCEIYAACDPLSVAQLRYRMLTQTAAEFYTKNIATPVQIVAPTLTAAGATTLAAAAGTYRKFTTANLPLLTGTQRYYMLEVAGNTNAANDAPNILGTRYISDTLYGPIIDNHSQAGYATSNYGTAHSVITDHANCFPFFTTVGYKVAFICYGHNDDGGGATKAQYKTNLSTLCTNLFAAGLEAIVLVSTSAKTAETAVKATYADADYELAQADPRISTVNVREITETDNGWSAASNATWTSDGLHHNATGAEVFQKAFFNEILALMATAEGTFELGMLDTVLESTNPESDYSTLDPIRVQSIVLGEPYQRGLYIIDIASLPPNGTANDAWIRFWPSQSGGPGENPFNANPIEVAMAMNTNRGVWSDLASWNTTNGDNPMILPGGGPLDFNIPIAARVLFESGDSTAPVDTENFATPFRSTGVAGFPTIASLVNKARELGQDTLVLRLRWVDESSLLSFYKHASDDHDASAVYPLDPKFYAPKLIVQMDVAPGDFTYISPSNGATSQTNCGVTLSWNSSVGATGYNVYFGSSGNPPLVSANQAGTTYATGLLQPGTGYFWRIEAINSGGVTTGPVWSFSTSAAIAASSSPTPANNATGVAFDPTISFLDPNAATDQHDLYIWKHGDTIPGTPTVSDFAAGDKISDYPPFDTNPFPWQPSTKYDWFVRSTYQCQAVVSSTFNFTTAAAGGSAPGVPTNPDPGAEVNCETGVSISTTGISWTNGANTDQVYIDIVEGDPGLLFAGVGGTFYDPAVSTVTFASEGITLKYGVIYYAQVIAVNAFGNTAGEVWCFIVENAPSSPPQDRTNRRYFRQFRFNRRQRV